MSLRHCLPLLMSALLPIVGGTLAAQGSDTLTEADLVVAGVRLGMSRSEVDSVFPPPPLGAVVRRADRGFRVEYDTTGHIHRIVLTSSAAATTRGHRVGDAMARVHELYGDGLEWTTRDSTTTIGFPKPTEWVGLTIIVHAGRVREIDVGPVTELG